MIEPKKIAEIPNIPVLSVRYGEKTESEKCESNYRIMVDDVDYSIWDTSLAIIEKSQTMHEIRFNLCYSDNRTIEFVFQLNKNECSIKQVHHKSIIMIKTTGNSKGESLEAFFSHDFPVFCFADRSEIKGNASYKLEVEAPLSVPFDDAYAEVWSWDGINIRKEAFHPSYAGDRNQENKDCIQYKVIQTVMEDFDVIYLDDGSGECADIVGIKQSEGIVNFHFYHCKYSKADKPGARKEDLYEVCGQAINSWRWKNNLCQLCKRLINRSSKHPERYMKGNIKNMNEIKYKISRTEGRLWIHIVQPGISKQKLSPEIKNLLSNVRSELKDYGNIESTLICLD
jgi:hypothetical protein